MKACHACGQKLPLKVGEVVEYRSIVGAQRLCRGIVTKQLATGNFEIMGFHGGSAMRHQSTLTRLHGYYRITERETL